MGITFAQNCSQRQCYRLEFICTFKYTCQFSANFCFFHSVFLRSIMFQTHAHDLIAMISHCQCLGLKSTWLKNLSPDFAKIFNSASIWIFYGRKGTFGGSSVSFRNGNAPFLSLWTNTKLLCRWERSKEEKIPNKYLQQGSSEKVFSPERRVDWETLACSWEIFFPLENRLKLVPPRDRLHWSFKTLEVQSH